MTGGPRTIGWLLDLQDRERLLQRFAPAYPQTVAHHVTLRSQAPPQVPLPEPVQGAVVGVADDARGVQALVVEIGGVTGRPDGSTYHITWSLAAGRQAKESNDVIAACGWTPLGERLPIRLTPTTLG